MPVSYQVDGNTFREITSKWLFAYVSEYLIKARRFDTDEAGNQIEHFQLNDGRVFSRLVSAPQTAPATKTSRTRSPYTQQFLASANTITQPR